MMRMKTVEAIIEGGKATAAPPLGPSLSQLGVNVKAVVEKINEKTEAFKSMKVPIKVMIDESTKEFDIEVGSPPVSALIKKELNLEKLAGPGKDEKGKAAETVGNLTMEQVVKIAKSKDIISRNLKAKVKQVVGTCLSCGVTVEGKNPKDVIKEIDEGVFDNIIKE